MSRKKRFTPNEQGRNLAPHWKVVGVLLRLLCRTLQVKYFNARSLLWNQKTN